MNYDEPGDLSHLLDIALIKLPTSAYTTWTKQRLPKNEKAKILGFR
jgi:hypothetical protein